MVHAGHRALGRVAVLLLLGFVLVPSVDARPARPTPPFPAPSGTIVNVSTEPQLQAAVAAIASNVTIVLAPGTYRLTRSLYFNAALVNIGIRGATADSSDVQLVGPGMTRIDYGAAPYGIWTGGGVDGITIANVTVRDFYFHPIIFNAGTQRPHVYNVHLIDAGQQFVKSNPDAAGAGASDGIVEYSIFEFTTTARDDYPKAIDVHGGANWRIRHNLFRNLQAPGGQLLGPAVLVWRGSTGTLTEGNTFINCGRGIMYGAEDAPGSAHSGGIIRNNFFYRSNTQPGDVGIQIADSPGTQVLNNTVILSGTYPAAIEYRYGGTTGAVIANNLVDGTIWSRDGATATVTANFVNAVPSMFVNAGAGDLHLLPTAVMAIDQGMTSANADTDWDGEMRPSGAGFDIGADEQGATSTAYRIAGRLSQAASGVPLAGVTVTLTGTRSQSLVSGADGSYVFSNLVPGGDYTVTPQSGGYMFSPPSYSYYGLASDVAGSDFSATAAAINQPPAVSLTGPSSLSIDAGDRVTLTALASDADGTVSSVTFYVNQSLVTADTSAPYSMTWKATKAGTYTAVAVARDDAGATTASSPATITVLPRSKR